MLPADYTRSEFLAYPQLVRFEQLMGQAGHEPVLLVKGSTLLLKYVALGVRMRLVLTRFNEHLLYALRVFDDPDHPTTLWSVAERDHELAALRAVSSGEPCRIFLFNEVAVNVAWAEVSIGIAADDLNRCLEGAVVGLTDQASLEPAVSAFLDGLDSTAADRTDAISLDIPGITKWTPVRNYLITSRSGTSLLDLFDNDEGRQQERIGVWLTDSLQSVGALQSPQVPKGKGTRELTDILVSYEHGSIFIESKPLAILVRDALPNRSVLADNTARHVRKAVSQLRGAIRKVKAGAPVTTANGDPVDIDRAEPTHAIVLIPELSLIQSPDAYGVEFIREFMQATGGFLHLLDPAELLRVVQAAEMIAARGTTTTPMMALDYYLIERAKKAIDAGTLCFEMLLRFEGE